MKGQWTVNDKTSYDGKGRMEVMGAFDTMAAATAYAATLPGADTGRYIVNAPDVASYPPEQKYDVFRPESVLARSSELSPTVFKGIPREEAEKFIDVINRGKTSDDRYIMRPVPMPKFEPPGDRPVIPVTLKDLARRDGITVTYTRTTPPAWDKDNDGTFWYKVKLIRPGYPTMGGTIGLGRLLEQTPTAETAIEIFLNQAGDAEYGYQDYRDSFDLDDTPRNRSMFKSLVRDVDALKKLLGQEYDEYLEISGIYN